MGSEKPDLGSDRSYLRSEKLDLGSGSGSEQPNLGSKRPALGSERSD